MSFQPIENYGVIGNMRSIALVGMDGSIDFLCYPDFDSPTVFAALLDDKEGGRFQIEPQLTNVRIRQLYLPDTNILLTRFLAEEGVAELTDYMPIEKDVEQPNEIIRTVSVIRGNVHFKMRCQPRFNYATSAHRTEISDRCATFFPIDDMLPANGFVLHRCSATAIARRDLGTSPCKPAQPRLLSSVDCVRRDSNLRWSLWASAFNRTSRFWKAWIAKSKYKGRWREMVNRSALMLKLLISREHGSLIAAATFSLPESIGGVRNWDYRFTWLRDATFTLYALIRLGFVDETEAFIDWLKGRLGDDAERGPLQVMYGIDGRQKLEELTLDHLSGYENSRPVRIGNAAYQQLQLDIYGEMMDAIYLANKYGDPISYAGWQGRSAHAGVAGEELAAPGRGHMGSSRRRQENSSTLVSCAGWPSIVLCALHRSARYPGLSMYGSAHETKFGTIFLQTSGMNICKRLCRPKERKNLTLRRC